MMGQPQALCEEDEIINRLRESRSDGEMFFDVEFGGVATALYENESEVPEYDQDLSEPVVWLRPQELAHSPEYFVDGALSGSVVEGRLGDGWLLGAMAAISGHPELLVENLFGSDPDDFKKWGVYTCRFYKNGSWVEVTTDTRAPATSGFGDGGAHGSPEPIYGRCLDPREQWVSLLEKAYAKLHGSYEALSGGSVTEALVDLTGGSGEEVRRKISGSVCERLSAELELPVDRLLKFLTLVLAGPLRWETPAHHYLPHQNLLLLISRQIEVATLIEAGTISTDLRAGTINSDTDLSDDEEERACQQPPPELKRRLFAWSAEPDSGWWSRYVEPAN